VKAVFLDRDGVINKERGEYTYRLDDFELIGEVATAITMIKSRGFKVIVITNQAGISRGLYTVEQMKACHAILQEACQGLVDDIYYAPLHPSVSESLARKPGTLMFERAIVKYDIDTTSSWMVGDKMRDLIPAKALGIKTILVGDQPMGKEADYHRKDLFSCLDLID